MILLSAVQRYSGRKTDWSVLRMKASKEMETAGTVIYILFFHFKTHCFLFVSSGFSGGILQWLSRIPVSSLVEEWAGTDLSRLWACGWTELGKKLFYLIITSPELWGPIAPHY